jgi:hypothetical protein
MEEAGAMMAAPCAVLRSRACGWLAMPRRCGLGGGERAGRRSLVSLLAAVDRLRPEARARGGSVYVKSGWWGGIPPPGYLM